jgi:hypothetical protein
MGLAVTVPVAGKYSCVVAGKVIGTSKHKDYWEYHYRLGDLRSLRGASLSKFVRVDERHEVESVLSAEGLRDKAVRDAVLPKDALTSEELAEVSGAVQLVHGSQQAAAVSEPADEAGADEAMAVIVGDGGAGGANVDATADAERQTGDLGGAAGTESVAGGGEQAPEPIAQMKPSRAKGRKR